MSEPRGPVVVVGRPRSGSRIVARMLVAAGIRLGRDLDPDSCDDMSIWQRLAAPFLTSRHFPLHAAWDDDAALARDCRAWLDDALVRSFGERRPSGAWGWKYCESALFMPVLKRLLPEARFVHIVRDGRDVCVSSDGYFQLSGPVPARWDVPLVDGRRPAYREFCRAVTFGDARTTSWRGIDLMDLRGCLEHRFLLQMQSWVHCVTTARRYGRELGGNDYTEMSYEALCGDPARATRELRAWLGGAPGVPGDAVPAGVDRTRIGRWRRAALTGADRRDLVRALDHGAPLLRELGYAG